MNKEQGYLIFCIFIFSVMIGFLMGVGVSMIPENKCIKNPLNYGISSLESDNLKVTCNCYFNEWGYMPFTFNKTGIFPVK